MLVRGGPSRVLTLRGALSPKFAQNWVFPLKLPENCVILKISWGQGGPWIRHCNCSSLPETTELEEQEQEEKEPNEIKEETI